MNENTAKLLRYAAKKIMKKSPKLKGPNAHAKPMTERAQEYGATDKQARRAMRLACEKSGREVPAWAQSKARVIKYVRWADRPQFRRSSFLPFFGGF